MPRQSSTKCVRTWMNLAREGGVDGLGCVVAYPVGLVVSEFHDSIDRCWRVILAVLSESTQNACICILDISLKICLKKEEVSPSKPKTIDSCKRPSAEFPIHDLESLYHLITCLFLTTLLLRTLSQFMSTDKALWMIAMAICIG